MNTDTIARDRRWPQGIDIPRAVSRDYLMTCAEAAKAASSRQHTNACSATRSTSATGVSTQRSELPAIDCVLIQHMGLDRVNQEDSACIEEHEIFCQGHHISFHLAVLADGCGGMAGGERASTIAVDDLSRWICAGIRQTIAEGDSSLGRGRIKAVFDDAFSAANLGIIECAAANPALHGMASTGACTLLHGNVADIAWAGDSRVVLYRNGRAVRFTLDHNRAQALVNAGILSPEEASGHPGRSHLTNALGTHDAEDRIPAVTRWHVVPGDLLVLSSDGFHEGVSPSLMAEGCTAYLHPEAKHDDLRTMARLLESASLASYGGDNLTAAFIYVRRTT